MEKGNNYEELCLLVSAGETASPANGTRKPLVTRSSSRRMAKSAKAAFVYSETGDRRRRQSWTGSEDCIRCPSVVRFEEICQQILLWEHRPCWSVTSFPSRLWFCPRSPFSRLIFPPVQQIIEPFLRSVLLSPPVFRTGLTNERRLRIFGQRNLIACSLVPGLSA